MRINRLDRLTAEFVKLSQWGHIGHTRGRKNHLTFIGPDLQKSATPPNLLKNQQVVMASTLQEELSTPQSTGGDLRALVLNAAYFPHQIVTWQDAITLVYQEKAQVLEEYDEIISSPSMEFFTPAVVRLNSMNGSDFKREVKFSRTNIFSRDNFSCGYCGVQFKVRELTFDHVLPRKQGGVTSWTNVISACRPCNGRKGARTPEQAGMKLLRRPVKPSSLPLHSVLFSRSSIPEVWSKWLGGFPDLGDNTYLLRQA